MGYLLAQQLVAAWRAVAWSLFGTSQMSGQTNGSDSGGYLWGFLGGLIGAAAALAVVATLRRNSN